MAKQKRLNGEGSIRKKEKNGRVYWEGRYTNEEGKQKSVSAKTQKECREKLTNAINEASKQKEISCLRDPDSIYRPDMTLNEFVDLYYINFKRNIKERTVEIQKKWAYDMVISPYLGDMKLNKITRKNIVDFMTLQSKSYANTSLCKFMGVLREVFTFLFKANILTNNPTDDIEVIGGTKKKEKRELNQEEIDLLLSHISERRKYLRLAVQIMLHTGMRCGEVLALQWQDIKEDYKYVSVTKTVNNKGQLTSPKNKPSIRNVPIDSFLKNELIKMYNYSQNRLKEANLDVDIQEEFIITAEARCTKFKDTHKPRTVKHIDDDLKEICKKIQQNHVDYPIISSHYFRHTFACRAARKNISLMHLLKICGWSNAQMLSNVYGHMTPQQSLDIINLIPPITYKGGFKYKK